MEVAALAEGNHSLGEFANFFGPCVGGGDLLVIEE
jgi:hypothetical protein